MYSMILGMASNGLIGKGDALPWHIPEDLTYFKGVTLNKIIVMGKKTFDSIGRPLPKRTNVVITRDKTFSHEGVIVFNSIEEFDVWALKQETEIIVIGGANLIAQMYDNISTVYLTHIDHIFEGDVYVDFIDLNSLTLMESESLDKSCGYDFDVRFNVYTK